MPWWSFVCSIDLQIRQIGNDKPFSIRSSVVRVKVSREKHQLFQFEIFLPQAIKQKKSYFANIKTFKNFEGHDHRHCRHITFWFIYNLSMWARYWWQNMNIWCYQGNSQEHFQEHCFLGDGNPPIITNKFWCEYLMYFSGASFMCSFSFLKNKSI